jgi:metal-dependent amidase/aminoacylase/carboxypeptidase family protein
VRAEDNTYLEELKQKVLNCFLGAATTSGARLEHRWSKLQYAPMCNNLAMARLFAKNMRSLGRKVKLTNPSHTFGSTDMGNVSQVVPSIHPFVSIAPAEVTSHSAEFAAAAASKAGMKGILDAAKALAMTVVDLLSSPETVTRAKEEFVKNT